jgi:hypothetical protein
MNLDLKLTAFHPAGVMQEDPLDFSSGSKAVVPPG